MMYDDIRPSIIHKLEDYISTKIEIMSIDFKALIKDDCDDCTFAVYRVGYIVCDQPDKRIYERDVLIFLNI